MNHILWICGGDPISTDEVIDDLRALGTNCGWHLAVVEPFNAGGVIVSDGHLVQCALDHMAGPPQPLRLWPLIWSCPAVLNLEL